MMRIRINFSKTETIKFTSHLDLYRAWERTLRRAALPMAYSQGFKPHPHINLACALPLGFTSENDLVDIWLDKDIALDVIHDRLCQAVPPGIIVKSIEEIPPQTPSLQKQLIASEYVVTLPQQVDQLSEEIDQLLSQEVIERERNEKKYNLRPLIHELSILPNDFFGRQQIKMTLQAQESATGRPEEVLLSLGIDPLAAFVHRQRLVLRIFPE
jgi:radical SAM-linked protein